MPTKIVRNTCPRNCFGSCSMLSVVEDGRLVKVTGDKKHGYTEGKLCAKGYSYTQYVYNPLRLKHPIMQVPRGSGNWKKISWDEAYTTIAKKILELNERYGSNLAAGYNKFSGNLGLLHYAVEGMFNSIGPHTKPVGNVCLATGARATEDSFGELVSAVPEHMAQSKAIVIWGANPAVTNVHKMKFIYEARKKGGKLVVIDPVFTETAEKADLYIQINPGTDAMLALGVSKLLLRKNDPACEQQNFETVGCNDFKKSVRQTINMETVCKITGVSLEAIEELTNLFQTIKPIATWNGFGLQRNQFGRESVKMINSLVALSGNLNIPHGGIYYAHDDIEAFPMALANFPEKTHPKIKKSRTINSSNFSMEAKDLDDPPLKLLWTASRSTLSQDQHIDIWMDLLAEIELVVTVDLFMTSTAKHSDIVLPAASHFEEEDLNVGYWHHWLSINEKAIAPFYEAKSDLKIARELTEKLNELSPGFSTFPSHLEPLDWIKKELSPTIKEKYSIDSYEDLLEGPKHQRKVSDSPATTLNTFTFILPEEVDDLFNTLVDTHNKEKNYRFRLLTPQSLLKIHSQFSQVTWLHPDEEVTIVEINRAVAKEKGILNGESVRLYNSNGAVTATAKTNDLLPENVVLVEQTSENSINQLIGISATDNHADESTHFYDCFVDIMK